MVAAATKLIALGGVLALAACSLGPNQDDPAAVVDNFVAATRNGDREAVYQYLGPRTRARLEGTMQSAKRVSGRLELKPFDFLSVGRAPPAWEPTSTRTVEVRGHGPGAIALVTLQSATGDRHDLELVREKGAWKIELPGP